MNALRMKALCGRVIGAVPDKYSDKETDLLNKSPDILNRVIESALDTALAMIKGEDETVSVPAKVMRNSEPEPNPDPIIRVDRSVRPSYPNCVKEVLYPDLESSGPEEYHITDLVQWLHSDQISGRGIKGNEIHAFIIQIGVESGGIDLAHHLGTRDLEEIRRKGVIFFREYFDGKNVFGWKGIRRHNNGNLYVPHLFECAGMVALGVRRLDCNWYESDPGLIFRR